MAKAFSNGSISPAAARMFEAAALGETDSWDDAYDVRGAKFDRRQAEKAHQFDKNRTKNKLDRRAREMTWND